MSYESIKLAEIDRAVLEKPDGKEIWAKVQRNFLDHRDRVDAIEGLLASVTADHFTGRGPPGDEFNLVNGQRWSFDSQGPGPKQVDHLLDAHVARWTVGQGTAISLKSKRIYRPEDLPFFEARIRVDTFANTFLTYLGIYRETTNVGLQPTDGVAWRKRQDKLPQFVSLSGHPDTPYIEGEVSPDLTQPETNEWFLIRIEWITPTVIECYFNNVLSHTFAGELGDVIPTADQELTAGMTTSMPSGFGGNLRTDLDWIVARNTALILQP